MNLLALVLCAAFVVAVSGLGSAVGRASVGRRLPPVYAMVLGLAVLVAVGGVANALGIASRTLLAAVLAGGVLLRLWLVWRARCEQSLVARVRALVGSGWALPWLAVALLAVFVWAALMPTALFNIHDDFHTYLPRVMRLLDTGTLGGDPFDVLGLDSQGAQSWLQAFLLAWLPITWVNGIDAVIAFVLGAALLVETARVRGAHWSLALGAVAVYVAINPQYVNVSALYTGVCLMLALPLAAVPLLGAMRVARPRPLWLAALPVGLMLAALVALKTTFVWYAAACWVGLGTLGRLVVPSWRPVLAGAAAAATWAALALAPWLLVRAPELVAVVADDSQTVPLSMHATGIRAVKELDGLFWGGQAVDYHLLFVWALITGAIGLLMATTGRQVATLALAATLVMLAAAVTYVADALAFRADAALRYAAPALIAASTLGLLLVGHAAPRQSTMRLRRSARTASMGAALAAAALIVGSHADVLVTRAQRAWRDHTLLSFPYDVEYGAAHRWLLESRQRVRDAQRCVPPGAALLALVGAPVHLDFRRNAVLAVTQPGLLNPWLRLPDAWNVPALARRLRGRGVSYVIYQYDGPGLKSRRLLAGIVQGHGRRGARSAYRLLSIHQALRGLWRAGEVLHDDGGLVVFRLPGVTAAPWQGALGARAADRAVPAGCPETLQTGSRPTESS